MDIRVFSIKAIRKIPILLRQPLLNTPLIHDEDKKFPLGQVRKYGYSTLPEEAAIDLLQGFLLGNKPCMIARFGRVEIFALARLHFMLQKKCVCNKMIDFMLWRNNGFTFDTIYALSNMKLNAGFWPLTKEALIRYYHLCLQDMQDCDILASWLAEERVFNQYLTKATRIPFCLGSFLTAQTPWTAALEGKKVLVVHPFAKSIEAQYIRRQELFPNRPTVLPRFRLTTIRAVQSIADEQPDFPDWFAALDYMKDQINEVDFDIALLGCGAYGFNLAAHVKRMGKKAVHIGGDLQYLFGIAGNSLRQKPIWGDLHNDAWINPGVNERPKGLEKVENGCYW